MNQIAWQIYGGSNRKANTFIGGVASTITTSGALATRLEIASNRITNFKIVGSDIECLISGSYDIPFQCFRQDSSITYYNDKDGLVTSTALQSFYKATNLVYVEFKNLNTIGFQSFDGDSIAMALRSVYTPLCTSLGGSVGYDFVFRDCYNLKLYCSITLATNNAGAPDGDISSVSGQSITARYVTNFTAPNPITNLSVGNVYGTAIQLNFTAPTGSTNAIDYYEVYVNGVYKNNISGSGGYATGLNLNTTYTIEVKPVDIFYNKSTSNLIVGTTANAPVAPFTDVDANAYISAATLTAIEQQSAYQLITDLKTAGLWTKIQAIYPFKGTTAAQHKWNAKNPLDTNAAFRLAFTGAATFSNLGYQLNGSSYANTFFAPNPNQNVNSNGLTIAVGTNNTNIVADPIDVAVYQSETQISLITSKGSETNFYKESMLNSRASSVKSLGVNDAKGILTGSRLSGLNKLFKNTSLLGSATASGTLPTNNFYIGALNYLNSPVLFTNQRIQMVAFHEGLSDAEVATLHAIIDTSEAIAGRRTW